MASLRPCYLFMSAAKPIWPRIEVRRPRRSFRRSSIIAELCLTNPSARWPILDSHGHTRFRGRRRATIVVRNYEQMRDLLMRIS